MFFPTPLHGGTDLGSIINLLFKLPRIEEGDPPKGHFMPQIVPQLHDTHHNPSSPTFILNQMNNIFYKIAIGLQRAAGGQFNDLSRST